MTRKKTTIDLLAVPYEATTSFKSGCRFGPAALLQELAVMERQATRIAGSPFSLTRADLRRFWLSEDFFESAESMIQVAAVAAAGSLEAGRIPFVLGGEHTVTFGPAVSAQALAGPIGMVCFDAHADLRNSYEGSAWSHACVMRRIREDLDLPAVQIGVRAVSEEEAGAIKKNKWPVIPPWELRSKGGKARLRRALTSLPRRVYVSFDLDAIDPSEAPGVGTPEPGGLTWYEVLDLLDLVGKTKQVVAADLVEFMPIPGDVVTPRLAVRLVERMAELF